MIRLKLLNNFVLRLYIRDQDICGGVVRCLYSLFIFLWTITRDKLDNLKLVHFRIIMVFPILTSFMSNYVYWHYYVLRRSKSLMMTCGSAFRQHHIK